MPKSLAIAVIEDDPLVQLALKGLLTGHRYVIHPDVDSFLGADNDTDWDLVLLDLSNPGDPSGARTIDRIPDINRGLKNAELVIESGISDVAIMRSCIKRGASRFILKDRLGEEVPLLLERLAEFREQREDLDLLILGESEVMLRLKRDLLRLKLESGVDILVEGETGTGKELCARALHAGGPLVAVNVSAIPAELFEAEFFGAEKGAYTGAMQARVGHFEAAGSGVLFLDEIQSLAPAHQAKFLRVLETRSFTRVGSSQARPFRARVVSASNRSLREMVSKGLFREDLYYRLAPLCLQLPSLRVRGEDIALLARAFLKEFDQGSGKSFTRPGLDYLCRSYDWPGNVRELRGLVRSLAINSPIPLLDAPEIAEVLQGSQSSEHSPITLPSSEGVFSVDWSTGLDENVERLERHILGAILKTHKSVEARDKLKLARSRFYEKAKQYGLLK